MPLDPGRELADLTATIAFCTGIVEKTLGHPIPVPGGLTPASLPADLPPEKRLALMLNIQRRWMNMLNLATTAAMVRHALSPATSARSVEAMLRYFVGKTAHTSADRDKADLLATHLYRAANGSDTIDDAEATRHARRSFEARLAQLFPDCPQISDQQRQLLTEFEFIRQDVEDYGDFDRLIESGIIARVRGIKEALGEGFYHPAALAAVSSHNAWFSRHFGALFQQATQKIKTFAERVQQDGGSLLTKLDGDVQVKHLVEVRENDVLNRDYSSAQEDLQRISRYKQAVERRAASKPETPAPAPAPVPAPQAAPAPEAPPAPPTVSETQHAINVQIEQSKLRAMEDAIRNFVRAMGQRPTCLVPLRNINLPLVAPEIEAFKTDFGNEKSFRADFFATHRRVLSVQARVMAETKDLESKQNSEYLWKPHAASLQFLMDNAEETTAEVTKILQTAEQRGLAEKVNTLTTALNRLKAELQKSRTALQACGTARVG